MNKKIIVSAFFLFFSIFLMANTQFEIDKENSIRTFKEFNEEGELVSYRKIDSVGANNITYIDYYNEKESYSDYQFISPNSFSISRFEDPNIIDITEIDNKAKNIKIFEVNSQTNEKRLIVDKNYDSKGRILEETDYFTPDRSWKTDYSYNNSITKIKHTKNSPEMKNKEVTTVRTYSNATDFFEEDNHDFGKLFFSYDIATAPPYRDIHHNEIVANGKRIIIETTYLIYNDIDAPPSLYLNSIHIKRYKDAMLLDSLDYHPLSEISSNKKIKWTKREYFYYDSLEDAKADKATHYLDENDMDLMEYVEYAEKNAN